MQFEDNDCCWRSLIELSAGALMGVICWPDSRSDFSPRRRCLRLAVLSPLSACGLLCMSVKESGINILIKLLVEKEKEMYFSECQCQPFHFSPYKELELLCMDNREQTHDRKYKKLATVSVNKHTGILLNFQSFSIRDCLMLPEIKTNPFLK